SRLFDISLNNLLLEGSTMVENIKKKAEIKQSKVYLACSSITNLVFLFILAVSPIFGELPIIISCALAIGTFFNFFCVLYFSRRYMELSDGKWDNRTNKQKIWSITFSVGLVIVLLAIILFIRFKYNAF
ncbi:XRE family transcriptional regulator, partial [Enterococcus thailandicus]|uniref:XRE family transcriptional regulator n=2 Tax=Enterococcus TaxID=1350 RepID=UPI0022EBBB8C